MSDDTTRVASRPSYETFGAHLSGVHGGAGVHFSVWAPNAKSVHVTGDFNDWANPGQVLTPQIESGVWSAQVTNAAQGDAYLFRIQPGVHSESFLKADPYATFCQTAPGTASRVWDLDYAWRDQAWMRERGERQALDRPVSIYEVHLGSWRREPAMPHDAINCRALAPALATYVFEMGFTHVELLPVMEHAFYRSWGDQTLAYFAPSVRYGTPQDFMYLVDYLHQVGIGVLLAWTPAHFSRDAHGLVRFDGTALYELADDSEPQNCMFNYGRQEVADFLLNSALFWLDKYHVDGLCLNAVTAVFNTPRNNDNTGATDFLRSLNQAIKAQFPDTLSIADDTTAGASWPVHHGGLGFDMTWNRRWLRDSLTYFERDPLFRSYHQDQLTFSLGNAVAEHFVLPLPHDEVATGQASLLAKMPGDAWQRYANLRLFLGCMWMHPGKKLLFMGEEFGQSTPWDHAAALDWQLLQHTEHRGIQRWVQDLNRCYGDHASLYTAEFSQQGFAWVDTQDHQQSVISFLRLGAGSARPVLVVCNCTPVPRHSYRVGIPNGGIWEEILNSDALHYGGSGQGNLGAVEAAPVAAHGHFHSLALTLPPLAMVAFTPGAQAHFEWHV